VAGFIGSNLLEYLLCSDQKVVGLDNFETGFESNLNEVKARVGLIKWRNFSFHRGDICNIDDCRKVMTGIDFVLHHAALGSVPRSIGNPIRTNEVNIGGFLNVLLAAKDANIKKVIYAASSSTYGDHPALPKVESVIGKPLSPYAVTKYVNELYADVFSKVYGLDSIGLRYFNVFGPRQNPNGEYAAVIARWLSKIKSNEIVSIYGDGETSRDFCYVKNVVHANIRAALNLNSAANNQVYNIALGDQTSLNDLFELLVSNYKKISGVNYGLDPEYIDFRVGDVRHSRADISKAELLLGYKPLVRIRDGLIDYIKYSA
jgi:UDP-N-acetylglucosamine 4-epimerase